MKINHTKRWMIMLVILTVAGAWNIAQATPKLSGIFTSDMVLQRDKAVPVWGWAEPGEVVTVAFAGQKLSAVADSYGRWKLIFKGMPASSEGREFTLSSDRTKKPVILSNVVVGDVWICSGQSNMEWPVSNTLNAKEEAASANTPLIRHFKIRHTTAGLPRQNIRSKWIKCSPQTVKEFTAVGYYFGRRLHQKLKVPIGLIGSNWSGTLIEPWVAPEGFRRVPELARLSKRIDATLPTTPTGKLAFLKTLKAMRDWIPLMEEAVKAGTPCPPKPMLPATTSTSSPSNPTSIYNAMIHPLIPFAIRGVIWYQGEQNGQEGITYFHKMRALIEGWRELWGEGDFPFYFTQLANFHAPTTDPAGGNGWAKLREAQRHCLTLPNTGMAVTIDIGNAKNIHPKNKQDVGSRLARWALAGEYGQKLVPSGPLYKGHNIEGNAIRLSFNYVGSGLMVGVKKGVEPTVEVVGEKLAQFAIAGADKKWYWAEGKIDGASVIVSSDKVAKPVAVRYAFRMNPNGCNLYNREGLPASPFRTDDW